MEPKSTLQICCEKLIVANKIVQKIESDRFFYISEPSNSDVLDARKKVCALINEIEQIIKNMRPVIPPFVPDIRF